MEITTNQLSLTGVIMENPQFDHEVFGEAFFRTVLSVPRLSGAFDLLPLTISERLMGEDFQQGATVAIGGQLRSYNKVMGGAGRLLLTAFAQHLRPVDEEENPNTVFLSGALCKPPILPHYALWARDCRSDAGRQSFLWQERLYSLHCLGAHGALCIGLKCGRSCAAAGTLPEPRVSKAAA